MSLETMPTNRVVANADDPLVVWAAAPAPRVEWVGTGLHGSSKGESPFLSANAMPTGRSPIVP